MLGTKSMQAGNAMPDHLRLVRRAARHANPMSRRDRFRRLRKMLLQRRIHRDRLLWTIARNQLDGHGMLRTPLFHQRSKRAFHRM